MNFPAGKVVLKGTIPFDFEVIAKGMTEGYFNGYIIQTVKASCIEESVLFFRGGNVYACFVECLLAQKSFKGREALSYFANEVKGNGYFQVIELARSQVDLIAAFDEALLLPAGMSLKDVLKSIPPAFAENFKAEEKGKDFFESYGLGELKS